MALRVRDFFVWKFSYNLNFNLLIVGTVFFYPTFCQAFVTISHLLTAIRVFLFNYERALNGFDILMILPKP